MLGPVQGRHTGRPARGRPAPGRPALAVPGQPCVPGQDDLQHLGHDVRLGELQRLQERPRRRHVRDGPPHGGEPGPGRSRLVVRGQVGRGAAGGVEGLGLAAVLQPDDRPGARGAGGLARDPRFAPQVRVGVQEPVEPRDPLIRLGFEEAARGPRDQVPGCDLTDADLLTQVAAQQGGLVFVAEKFSEGEREVRLEQRRELAGGQEFAQLTGGGQLQVPRRGVAAAGGGDEFLLGERGAHRVEQRAQHRAGREARRLEGERLEDLHREQPAGAQFPQHVDEEGGGRADQDLVGGVVARDVVARGRGPVRALDQEAEEGLLLRREEHDQRGAVQAGEPGFAVRGAGAERELDPLAGVAEVVQRPFPDEPVLGADAIVLAPGERDTPARQCWGCRGARLRPALDDRAGDSGAVGPQPGDVAQEQQGRGLDPVQRGGDLPGGGGRGHRVVVEREHEQGLGGVLVRGVYGIHGGRPHVVVDPEVLRAAVDARGPGVRVHGLEADAELPDLGEVPGLPALRDPGHAAHVRLRERPAVVPDLQPVAEQPEVQPGRARVLGVLDQLEDEVGALAVQVAEQIEHGRVPAVTGDVLIADLLVVRWHP